MDTCAVETGLLKKKPCGHAAVTHCLNCEMALCAQHAVPELTATGKKSGKFLCKECQAAHVAQQKALKNAPPAVPPPAAKTPAAGAPKAATAPPAAPAAKPAAPPAGKPKEPPADEKSGANYGGIDFTPTKKP